MTHAADIYSYYNGFYIDKPIGNNEFSFEKRKNRRIFIPALKKGKIKDLSLGTKIVFSEVEKEVEVNLSGLEYFIHLEQDGKELFIFDNHNHAFFFWVYALNKGLIGFSETLVHVDQHSDLRKPKKWFNKKNLTNPKKVFNYTNYHLNVGNFILPAQKLEVFSKVEVIDSSTAFEKSYSNNFVLDIDIDIFSKEMNYIPDHIKLRKIREYLKQAKFITIATSPYFIDQEKALHIIRLLLKKDN